ARCQPFHARRLQHCCSLTLARGFALTFFLRENRAGGQVVRARVHLAARWGGVLLVLAFAVPALAACLPPPPPPTYQSQYCAPVTPSTPGAYQSAFDNMRLAGVEWAAADGGHPTKLPDGRVVWLYGDTFTGQIQRDGSLAPGWRLPRNSFVLQNGACFQPLM